MDRYLHTVNSASPHLFPDTSLQEVARIIRSVEPQWRGMGASRVRIFGSVARGEATDLSDVDLLVDFAGEAGLLDLRDSERLAALAHQAEQQLLARMAGERS